MTDKSSRDIFFYGSFVLGALFVAGGWFWTWFALRDARGPFILHFSDYTGINQIGDMADIHGLGATGIVVVVLNFILARTLWPREARWAKILAGTTLFLAVLLFTALAAIISVNQ